MAMTRQAKEEMVERLSDSVVRAKAGIVFNYSGLNVEQVSTIRRKFREAEVDYRVVKNTLMKRALAGTPIEALQEEFSGTTAIAFKYDEEYGKLGKTAEALTQEYGDFEPKGGFVETDVLDEASALKTMASLPTMDEARAQLLGVINAPAAKLLAQINAPATNLLGVIQAKVDKDKE